MTDHGEKPPRWSDLLGAIPPTPGPAPDVTTAEVRERYMAGIEAKVWGLGSHTMDDYGAAFTRWLAAHDAEVAARAALAVTQKWAKSILRGQDEQATELDDLRVRADELGQP